MDFVKRIVWFSLLACGIAWGQVTPVIPPYQMMGNATDTYAAPSPVATNLYYPSVPVNSASIGLAAVTAYNNGGGTVVLPLAVTITAPLPVWPGVSFRGVDGWGYQLISGTFTAFGTIVTCSSNSFDGIDFNSTDGSTEPTNNVTFLTGMVPGVWLQNIWFTGCSTGVKFGALYQPGIFSGGLYNVGAMNNHLWGIWEENFFHSNFTHVYSTGNGAGQCWFVSSGGSANQNGNSTANDISCSQNSGSGVDTVEGLVIGARGTSGLLNQFNVYQINAELTNRSAKTQAATMSNTSCNIGVTDSTQFVYRQPVTFSASVNGFTAGVTYFITSSGSNVVNVSALIGGACIAATGSTAVNIITHGFAPVEIYGDDNGGTSHAGVQNSHFVDLDIEWPTGTSNSAITVQELRDSSIYTNYVGIANDATLVWRESSGQVCFFDSASTVTYDINNTFANPQICGIRSSTTQAIGTSNGVGITQLGNNNTDSRCANATNTSTTGGGALLSITGIYGIDACYNKNSYAIDWLNFPFSFKSTQLVTGQTINGSPATRTTSNVVCPGSGSNTAVLPTISSNGEGLTVWVTNPSSGTCTVSAQSGVNIVGYGTSSNSFVIGAETNAHFWSVNAAGTLQWSVQ